MMRDFEPYRVEPMTLADVSQVMEIESVAFSSPWSARAYRYEITQNEHSLMLVVREIPSTATLLQKALWRAGLAQPKAVLGYAGAWFLVDEIHVATIAVDPRWRGRGLGELLLLSLLERGIKRTARRATLEVRVSNLVAQGLYHRYGFQIISTNRRYYSDNNEDAYIMATPPFDSPPFRANLERCRGQLRERFQAERGVRNRAATSGSR
jgi:ribosomal-protein-alanine N-acetyltransferase